MSFTSEQLRDLMEAFERSGWTDLSVTVDGGRIELSKVEAPASVPAPIGAPVNGASAAPPAPAPVAVEASAPEPVAVEATPVPASALAPAAAAVPAGHELTSPSVGIFWRAPAPGAPPFVEVGAAVAPGETIGIVEVMKLMNHVTADVAGTVLAIPVGNGDTVEHGQALVILEPTA